MVGEPERGGTGENGGPGTSSADAPKNSEITRQTVSYDHVAWLENLNLVARVKTGSRVKFGRYRWERLEMVPIGAFDPKRVKTGKKLNPGRSG